MNKKFGRKWNVLPYVLLGLKQRADEQIYLMFIISQFWHAVDQSISVLLRHVNTHGDVTLTDCLRKVSTLFYYW